MPKSKNDLFIYLFVSYRELANKEMTGSMKDGRERFGIFNFDPSIAPGQTTKQLSLHMI